MFFSRDKKRIFILSVDGGGMRGVLPASVLREIEKRMAARGIERPLYSLFDLISATSTGCLIGLGLASPRRGYSASDALDFYRQEGPRIFSRPGRSYIRKYMDTLRLEYDHTIIESVLANVFGDDLLSQCTSEVLVTSFDTVDMQPFMFKRHRSRRTGEDFYLRDIARASTAAPSLFKPALVRPAGPNGSYIESCEPRTLLDGGIFANNPSLIAFEEASRIYPEAKHITILSLGTGVEKSSYSAAKLEKFSSLDWINPFRNLPVIQMMQAGQNTTSNHILSKRKDVELIRINTYFEGCVAKVDDGGENNFHCLEETAANLIEVFSKDIDRFIDLISDQRNGDNPRRP